MIHLVDVDDTNWRIPLSVSNEQKLYVANTTSILARAYAYRNSRSRAFLVYKDDEPIGMGLYHDCEPDAYIFSELLIDKQFQGQGYGKAATKLILDCMKKDGKYHKAILCYMEGNRVAKNLYESFGFVEIDRDEDEIIMKLEW